VSGQWAITLRDQILPLYDLGACLGSPSVDPATASAVVVKARDQLVGLLVGRLIGQQELVTRPLPAVVSDGEPVSAGAALADGQLALVVDCDVLASTALSGIQLGLTTATSAASASPAQRAA
jgi:two-component system chemotaxis sensor kinase CheA